MASVIPFDAAILSEGFIKSGASNNSILLAGGGHADRSLFVETANFKSLQLDKGERRKIQLFGSETTSSVQTNSTMGTLIMEPSVKNNITYEFNYSQWIEGDILTMVNRSNKYQMNLLVPGEKGAKSTAQILRLVNGGQISAIAPYTRVKMQWIIIAAIGYWYEI